MIVGAHTIIYSTDAQADRAFLRDVLGLRGVDAGGGWLIFALPPAEVAVHPADTGDRHELYLLCDDIEAFVGEMADMGVSCGPVEQMSWGLLTRVALPSGATLGVYQPVHERPHVD
ncbi:MAG TPA: extradiol dioxygenase [Thermoleophilia bacterium]|nr:extradiol dioxygenase [Thermoleophilia bacterium]